MEGLRAKKISKNIAKGFSSLERVDVVNDFISQRECAEVANGALFSRPISQGSISCDQVPSQRQWEGGREGQRRDEQRKASALTTYIPLQSSVMAFFGGNGAAKYLMAVSAAVRTLRFPQPAREGFATSP